MMKQEGSSSQIGPGNSLGWEEVISENDDDYDGSSLGSLQEHEGIDGDVNVGLTPDNKTSMKKSAFMTPLDNSGLNQTISTHKQAPQDRTVSKSHEPILSPPFQLFSPSPAIQNETYQGNKQRLSIKKEPAVDQTSTMSSIKEDVENLVERFNEHSRFTVDGKRKKKPDSKEMKSKDSVDEDLESIRQKTNSLVEVLQKNYLSISQLQNENMGLKQKLSEYQKSTAHNKYESKISSNRDHKAVGSDLNLSLHDDEILSPLSDSATNDIDSHYLDPSDNFVHRSYPTICKSPGTMFVTELLDYVELEVGHHAHLAQILDRHWGATNLRKKKFNNS